MIAPNLTSRSAGLSLWQKPFLLALLVNTIWINASEVFRYFAFVMPMMRDALPSVENVAPMNLVVFASWGVWDAILVLVVTISVWVMLDRFGPRLQVALTAATGLWLGIFVILWLGLFNMNLATVEIMLVALPLAWIEMAVAALIVRHYWRASEG